MGNKYKLKKEIGKRFKGIRIDSGLNQTEFGAKIGLKQQQVAKIESGDQNLDIAVIILLKDVFNISFAYLLSGKESKGDKYTDRLEKENEWLRTQLSETQKLRKEMREYQKDLIALYDLLKSKNIDISKIRRETA